MHNLKFIILSQKNRVSFLEWLLYCLPIFFTLFVQKVGEVYDEKFNSPFIE
jgi:hypothetical protein